MGVQGVGKSRALLDIARKCKTDTFYVWDNDKSAERLLATAYRDITERESVETHGLGVAYGNVVVRDADEEDWEEFLEWVTEARGVVRFDDWINVDSMTPTWPAVQSWFTDQVFGDDIADYFMQVRLEKAKRNERAKKGEGDSAKTLGAFEGFMDWPVINKQYAKIYTLLRKIPCHVMLTAEAVPLAKEDSKDKELMAVFGAYGVKPAGQKRLGHKPMTDLLLTKTRVGEYYMTTIKDRGREEVEEMEWGDFAVDYLSKLAGWKMRKVDA